MFHESRPGVTATALEFQISDFRFQIEGFLITNWVLSNAKRGIRNSEPVIRNQPIEPTKPMKPIELFFRARFHYGFSGFSSFSVNFQSAICNRTFGGTLIFFAIASLPVPPKLRRKGRSVPTPLGRVPGYTVSRHQFMKHPS